MKLSATLQALFVSTKPNEIRLSPKQALIVGMLARNGGEMTGYELVKASGNELTLGGIYTHLDRLERKGVILSHIEVVEEGVRRLPKRFVRLNGGSMSQKRSKSYETETEKIPKGFAVI